jgi:hypothetical protein
VRGQTSRPPPHEIGLIFVRLTGLAVATAGVAGTDQYTAFGYTNPTRRVLAVVRTVKWLQSGRLDAYLAYMLIALIAILAVVTALG